MKSLLTVVPDTNIFVSGTILSHGIAFEILESWRHQEFILVTSEVIMDATMEPRFLLR